MGGGGAHHVAFRGPALAGEEGARGVLARKAGLDATPVLDRQYFHSVYFREPGGVLFEIATDPPGFAADEEPDHLGENLKLPPWLEKNREHIEAALPPLRVPAGEDAGAPTSASPTASFRARTTPASRCSCCTVPAATRGT